MSFIIIICVMFMATFLTTLLMSGIILMLLAVATYFCLLFSCMFIKSVANQGSN